jgi:tRNA-splicing ligase RtcB
MKDKLKQINDYEWILPKESRKEMKVDGKLIANKAIHSTMEDGTIEQLSNVCCLPGVVEPVCAMSDAHFGYGLPMGAVMAFDAEEGMISSGCTGFDINCGVNSIRTNLTFDEVKDKVKELIPALFDAVPCGVGSKGKLRLELPQLDDVLKNGCNWAVENGYGVKEDIKNTEENGCMQGADPSKVSDLAKKRGKPQCGTLGAGNHFLEIQKVETIYDKEYAKKLGLTNPDQVVIMLHCGSRGLGHQVASDYLKIHEQAVKKYNIWLPDKQLVGAPANSKEGQDYYKAMQAAVNYAFTNRLIMTQWIRDTFEKIFKKDWESMDMHTIYAIAHNITKKEEHKIDGKKKEVYITRKGATRAFPDTPALIAGTMGTASYICKGTEEAMEKTFGSTVHGAGRAMSRTQALRQFRGEKISNELLHHKGSVTKATSVKSLAEEAPLAYKDVDEVIESVHGAGVSLKVAKLSPIGVLKG